MPALPRGFALVVLVYAAAHLAIISSWRMWWGGHSWGPRLATELVPLLALFCAMPIHHLIRRKGGQVILAVVLAISACTHLPLLFGHALAWNSTPIDVDTHPARNWSWSDPPFLRWTSR